MDEQRRQDYLAMKAALTEILDRLNDQIEFYPFDSDEKKYQDLIRKAIYYRDLIRQIDQQLNAD
jgi:hypothetical protein